jgi:chromosome segregation ATPase
VRERKAAELEERLELHLSAKVLEQHVMARQAELDDLLRLHKQTMVELKRTEDAAYTAIKTADAKAAAAEVEARNQQDKLTAMVEQIKEAKAQLAATTKEINDRKRYLNEQEVLIEQALASGNETINAANREVISLNEQKNNLLLSTHKLTAKLAQLQEQVDGHDGKFERAKALYTTTVKQYRDELADVRQQATELKVKMLSDQADIDQAKERINQSAHELGIKSDTLQRMADELEAERRRIESRRLL